MNSDLPRLLGPAAAFAAKAFAAALLVVVATGCSEPTAAEPADVALRAPGTGGAPDAGCEPLESDQRDACRVAWICPDTGRLTFVCFNEEAGMGCGCMVEEQFTEAFTMDLSACGDAAALAALARETCGWDVP